MALIKANSIKEPVSGTDIHPEYWRIVDLSKPPRKPILECELGLFLNKDRSDAGQGIVKSIKFSFPLQTGEITGSTTIAQIIALCYTKIKATHVNPVAPTPQPANTCLLGAVDG